MQRVPSVKKLVPISNVRIGRLTDSLKRIFLANDVNVTKIDNTQNGTVMTATYNGQTFNIKIESPANNKVSAMLNGKNVIISKAVRTAQGVVIDDDAHDIATIIISAIVHENPPGNASDSEGAAAVLDKMGVDPQEVNRVALMHGLIRKFYAAFEARMVVMDDSRVTHNGISATVWKLGSQTSSNFLVEFYGSDVFCYLGKDKIYEFATSDYYVPNDRQISDIINAVCGVLETGSGTSTAYLAPGRVRRPRANEKDTESLPLNRPAAENDGGGRATGTEAMQNLLERFRSEFQNYGFDMISSEVTYNSILMDIQRGDDKANRVGVQFRGQNVYCSMNGQSLNRIVTDEVFTLNRSQILEILDAVMGKLISEHPSNEDFTEDDLVSVTGRPSPGPGRLRPFKQGDARGGNRIYDVASDGLDDSSADGMAARGRTAGALYTQPFFQVLLRLLNILVGDDLEPLDGETVQMLRNIVDVIKSTPFPR